MDLGEFMEQATIAPAFGPVDMTTAANPGAWVSMRNYKRLHGRADQRRGHWRR